MGGGFLRAPDTQGKMHGEDKIISFLLREKNPREIYAWPRMRGG